MSFPLIRGRRLRKSAVLRSMVRETVLNPADFVYPLFVVHGSGVKREIQSMPGNYHFSVDCLVREAAEAFAEGVPAVLLFGIPESKDPVGSSSLRDDGIVQQAVRTLKTSCRSWS